MRLIAIGDIHGEASKLEEVLEKISPTQEDKIVFLGDYVDRGPEIIRTLDIVSLFAKDFPSTVLLMGNHEEMMLDSTYRTIWTHKQNGGDKTMADFQIHNKRISDYNHLWNRLVYKHKEETNYGTYYFSHAGWHPSMNLERQYEFADVEQIVWGRNHLHDVDILEDAWSDGIAVFGHTPLIKPLVSPTAIGLDTGAVFPGGCLTAAILPTEIGQRIEFHHSHINEV